MSMTVHTAHVYVVSEKEKAYFNLSFDNEMSPELAIKDSIGTFIDDYISSSNRKELISKAFDANYDWDDEDPFTLEDEIEFESDLDISEEYTKFCNEIETMDKIGYVLFAVDSNKHDWLGYSTYYYDAMVFDFEKRRLYSIEWRGTELQEDKDSWDERPFYKSTAEYLIKMIEAGKAEQIDVGDFVLSGKKAGTVTVKELRETGKPENKEDLKNHIPDSTDEAEAKQIKRITSLIKRVDDIDFDNKVFVFDTLDYVPVRGVYCGPDSPDHPIVKRVLEAGGLMRKSVSGKTNYLVINTEAYKPGTGAKCRDTLIQIDKGKSISVITLDNLLELLDE